MAIANALNVQLEGATGAGEFVGSNSPFLITPALGTPNSGNLSNCTNLPISTGVSGLGANVETFLATPTSANLAAAVTDETGSGSLVFSIAPSITNAALTTPDIGAATGTSLDVTSALSVNSANVIVSAQRTVFTSSGVYNAPASLEYALVEVIGAGGGSGGCSATGTNGAIGGGGGSGGYSASLLDAVTIGASQTVTIGAGGSGGAAGATSGTAGGASSFGVLVVANGGLGGSPGSAVGNNTISSTGVSGGSVGTGQYAIPGGSSMANIKHNNNINVGGTGAGSTIIGSVSPPDVNLAAIAGAANTGQGAAGGGNNNGQAAKAGATGGSGVIIITEFLSS